MEGGHEVYVEENSGICNICMGKEGGVGGQYLKEENGLVLSSIMLSTYSCFILRHCL